MRNLFLALFFVSATASASGLEGIFKEVIKSVVQDIAQEGGPQSANNQPLPASEISEGEIVDGMECVSRLGWQSPSENKQACYQRHYDQCLNLLASLPNNDDGLERFRQIFSGYQSKCEVTKMEGDRNTYRAAVGNKQSQICLGILDSIPLDKELSRDFLARCDRGDAFRARYKERAEKISAIEQEKKKVARELGEKANAGLIEKYKRIVPAPSKFLLSDVVVQWGGSNFGPLIKFIDAVQNNAQSKAKYEMNGNNLVMRHRIADSVTGKSSNITYVFGQFKELPPGEILLTRVIAEKSMMGGLIKDQEEVDVKDIGMTFALIYRAMTGGK